MKLFRVESSKNELAIGSTIKSSGRYSEYLQQEDEKAKLRCAIEDVLDKLNPNGEFHRRDCLFAFSELKDALIFSADIYQGNAQIYEISANCKDILHKGDMNLLDLLVMSVEKNMDEAYEKMLKGRCVKYWGRSDRTHTPCLEYLLNQAKVERLICTAEECSLFYEEYKTIQYGYLSLSVERTSVYIDKMTKIYKRKD